MSVSIPSLVRRTRRQLANFVEPAASLIVRLPKGEEALGLYHNQVGEDVLFTSAGLRWRNWPLIGYDSIAQAEVLGEKEEAFLIRVSLTNGESKELRFDGGNGNFRDVWEILRLLDRIYAVVHPEVRTPNLPDS